MVHRIAPPPEIEGLTWVRALGSGGFADVHLYRQSLPARDVAVKVVRDPTESGSVDEMHREADATAAVAGHPAVIELHGAGTTADGRPYLIMEYCPVADIGEQARARPMAVDRTLDLIIRVCGGVEALHRAGLVHRDIKPSNIMLDAYGRPVLADFGVAAPIGELEPGRLDGFSVLWAPPEQQDARTHAHPTQDVWALAATTWTLLTGRSPFEDPLGDNGALAVAHRVRSGRLRGLGRPDAPAQLEGVLRAAMALDPLERTGSAPRLGEDLQGIQRIMGRPVTAMSIEPGGLAAEPVLPAADGWLTVPTGFRSSGGRARLWSADGVDQGSVDAADALALVHNRQPLTRTPPTLAQYRAAVEQNDTGWAEVVLATDDDSCDLMVSGRRVVPPERVCALQSDHPTYMETGRLSADGSRVLFDGDHGDRMPAVLDLESHGFLAMPPAPTRAEKDGANVRPTLVSSSLLVTFDDDDRTLRGYDLTAG